MRILLTDDEPLTVDAMEHMLQKKFGKQLVIDKAYSGKEAIEFSMNNRPDLVVMDINMPGLDGMEAIRRIKEIYLDIHFLIVTAMEYFDYAVESVKMEEIEEYILKPVRKDIFLEAVSRVMKKIEAQKEAKRKELQMEEQMQLIIPILEKNFIGSICMDGYGKNYIREFAELFSIAEKKAYIMIMEFGERHEEGTQNGIGSSVLGVKYYKEYSNLLKRMCSCMIGDIIRNRIVILVYGDFENSSYEEKSTAMQIALRLLRQADYFENDASISIGKIHPVAEVKRSYHEAVQASYRYREYTMDTRIYHIEDIEEDVSYGTEINGTEKLINCIMKGEREASLTVIQDIYMNIRWKSGNKNLEKVKNQTLSIVAHIQEECKKVENIYIQTLEKIIKSNSIQGLQKICEEYVQNVIQRIYMDKEEKTKTVIEQANQYMMEHLSEKVSLEEIARSVNLSEYYFSRLYKSAVGKNYSDQLVCFRMEKAKSLIREKDYTVREIAEMVGYMDPNYLSKVFKKYTGVTISDYKSGNYGR